LFVSVVLPAVSVPSSVPTMSCVSLLSLFCLSSLLVSLAFCDDVHELSDASFNAEMADFDTALVMFYAPWCGHCKKIKPEFEKAASLLKDHDPPIALAKVDCTEAGKDTCSQFSVSGYPTLKIFRGGEFSQDYNGPRELAGIVKYMKSQVGDSAKECKSQSDVDALLKKEDVVIMHYFEDDDDEHKAFMKTADSMRETVSFGFFKGGSKKGVILHRPKHLQTKLEPTEMEYSGKVTKDDLAKWVKANYHGLVGHRTIDNAKEFGSDLVLAYYEVDYVKNVKGTNYWRNRIMKVAKGFPNLNFAVANKDDFQQETTEFGMSHIGGDKPRIVIMVGKKKYVMEDEFSVENFEKFMKDFEAGKAEAYIKSEDVPVPNDKPVKVAVAKNFEELVEKSDKDVLIEFYAPWCGHCKKLTPIYDQLGEKMADENVEIVKMDATANDVGDGFDVKGFPTLVWYPKDTKKPVSYGGGRELDDFVKYIAEHATDELKSLDRKGNPKKEEL
jgi:protein disulfide isomerase family A protein 3